MWDFVCHPAVHTCSSFVFLHNQFLGLRRTFLNAFATGNPYVVTKLLEISVGRGLRTLKLRE